MLRYFLYHESMEERNAIKAFAALAQEHRLTVFRLLVRHAPEGLPAGQIAAQVGVPASTMSAHLAQLERAGLLRSWREQRRILYAVETEGIRQLVLFLTEDCCGSVPSCVGIACRSAHARAGEHHLCDASGPRSSRVSTGVFTVLFLCTGHAALRSMAEAILHPMASDRLYASSGESSARQSAPVCAGRPAALPVSRSRPPLEELGGIDRS